MDPASHGLEGTPTRLLSAKPSLHNFMISNTNAFGAELLW